MEREMPKAGEVWRHFKGNCYLIIAAARHTETGEMYVVYKALTVRTKTISDRWICS